MDNIWIGDVVSGTPCDRCGGLVIEFSIPNDVWNKVIRIDGEERWDEYICMGCFLERLRVSLGIREDGIIECTYEGR